MIRLLSISIVCLSVLWGCQREEITFSTQTKDLFFVQNQGASMPVLVEGNTVSDVLLLVVHGGPGSDALQTMNGSWMAPLESRYAVAYWDQRNAGSTQGGANHDVLKVATFADDLKKIITVLKHRYGANRRIFLYSHSWGGCLSAAFLTQADNQLLVNGWINLDGATDFPLKDTESKDMQLRIGTAEKTAGRNVAEWTAILDYAQANDPRTSPKVSERFNDNAFKAIKLMDQVNKPGMEPTNDLRYSPNSLMSRLVNFYSVYAGSSLETELFKLSFSALLPRLNLPVLCLFGKYDFVVPPAVGQELLNRISSTDKRLVVLNRSGHDPYATEPDIVNEQIIRFIERIR
ncbi:alpha/beta fold hydrolase [Arundinibacter roseus]|uniref:Alpha/beta hydrolase n=1 Tax=Arundinibacter roseus TaxID=2070510 RepID=A0A4R4K892_9BACT|nr:alpha/beta hydrolase [Arundinibacter roseus]TDB62796.1 alpha/beta hydrolase [Arundinibacter roseus]